MTIVGTENVWLTKKIYDDAETAYYENLNKAALTPLAGEVAKARQRLIESRDNFTESLPSIDIGAVKFFEKKAVEFQKSIDAILKHLSTLDRRIESLESNINLAKPVHEIKLGASSCPVPKKAQQAAATNDEDDDDVDLFGSDSEEENDAAAKVREERLAAYAAKKAKKPALIAKSNVILDIKPWDDETDMKLMEDNVRKIQADGLLWGTAKLVPLAYGIHKLQISSVVEDEKVSIDWLTEQIEAIEDYVQSVDIAAFNKI